MKFNFTSQVCTSRSQSERLLALGLKRETADMTLQTSLDVCYTMSFQEAVEYFENRHLPPHPTILPAWSLHRLLCLLPREYIYDIDFQRIMQDFVFGSQDMYDEMVSCIETLIEAGYIYQEYLEE